MPRAFTLREHGKWKFRLAVALALIGPLYILPVLLRLTLAGWWGYFGDVVVSDIVGCAFVGFITNNYRFGVLLYLGSNVLEFLLVLVLRNGPSAMIVGDLLPALVSIYYAQQLFINLGD